MADEPTSGGAATDKPAEQAAPVAPSAAEIKAMIDTAVTEAVGALKQEFGTMLTALKNERLGDIAAQVEAAVAKLAKGGTTVAIVDGIKAWMRRDLQWHSEGKTPEERDALHP